MNIKSILLGITIGTFALCSLQADDTLKVKKKSSKIDLAPAKEEVDWSVELGTGALIADIRTDNTGYTEIPAEFTASLKLDNVSLDKQCGGIFRGYTEWVTRGYGIAVVNGIEDRFVGVNFGPCYNFVQEGWKVVPFVEGNVGFGFTDSRGLTLGTRQVGQGQDFCFNFGVRTGVTYDITPSWFIRGSAVFTHFSNAGLSEPTRKNRSQDAIGPVVSVGYRF